MRRLDWLMVLTWAGALLICLGFWVGIVALTLWILR
jgi:hypothetical protein